MGSVLQYEGRKELMSSKGPVFSTAIGKRACEWCREDSLVEAGGGGWRGVVGFVLPARFGVVPPYKMTRWQPLAHCTLVSLTPPCGQWRG